MPMLDAFTPNAFKLVRLTAAINKIKYKPGRIAALGWFEENGITTLDAAIEERGGSLALLDILPRGAPGTPVHGTKRKIYTFRVPHIPESATIMSDEVQGVRAFGSETQAEVLQARINERLAQMKLNMDYTIESHRVSALKGLMYDVNGVPRSLFTEFGVAQQTINFALGTATTKIRTKIFELIEKVESALDGVPYTGIRVLCGSTFFKDFVEHDMVKESFLATQMATTLRANPTNEFVFGDVIWERYRGTTDVQIGDTEAFAVPQGVNGLFLTRFAPADYNETVGTTGLPYYVKSEPLKFGKGYEMEAQSNPINLCTRPDAIVKLTRA